MLQTISYCQLQTSTLIFREKRTFKEFWHLFKHNSFIHLGDFWQYTNWSMIIFLAFWVLFMNRCYICSVQQWWIWRGIYTAIKIWEKKSPKMSEFSFIILVEISVFCVALLMIRLFSSLRISSFRTFLNEKWDLELQNVLIATMLGWFRYPTTAFRSGPFIFSEIGSSTFYCWMSRFWTIFEKKTFKSFSSFSIRVILFSISSQSIEPVIKIFTAFNYFWIFFISTWCLLRNRLIRRFFVLNI